MADVAAEFVMEYPTNRILYLFMYLLSQYLWRNFMASRLLWAAFIRLSTFTMQVAPVLLPQIQRPVQYDRSQLPEGV